jgi:ABC-2 type transport system permease protein
LLQLLVWGVSSLLVTRANDTMITGVLNALTPALMFWLLLYLILGYLLYGSIMAAAGALAPTAREGGQATWLMVMPLIPTLLFISEFAEDPQGTLPLVLSLFPLTAPSAMVTRLALAPIPFWQVAVSLGGVILTAYLFVSLAARFFRADNLLSGEAFSLKRFFSAWR